MKRPGTCSQIPSLSSNPKLTISVLTLSDSKHLSAAYRAYTLGSGLAILHDYAPGVLHFPFGTALHAVCLH